MAETIEFLGFVIGGGQISPGTVKSQAIEKFPTPRDVLTGFFRRFVQNYATLAESLSRLTKKDVVFKSSATQETAFNETKRVFVDKPIFCMFDPKAADTEIHTDASSVRLGHRVI